MKKALLAAGVLSILLTIISALSAENPQMIFITLLNGFLSLLVYFSFYLLLENQEHIQSDLEELKHMVSRSSGKKNCAKCGKEYDADMTSCPHCGNR